MINNVKDNWLIALISGGVGSIITLLMLLVLHIKSWDSNLTATWIGAIGGLMSGVTAVVVTIIAIKTYKKALIAYKEQAKINEEIRATTEHKIKIISKITEIASLTDADLLQLQHLCVKNSSQKNETQYRKSIKEILNYVNNDISSKLTERMFQIKSLLLEVSLFYSALPIERSQVKTLENTIKLLINAISTLLISITESTHLIYTNNKTIKDCQEEISILQNKYNQDIITISNQLYQFLQN